MNLEYWKNNAEEDYYNTPISALKYISKLEDEIHNLKQPKYVNAHIVDGKDLVISTKPYPSIEEAEGGIFYGLGISKAGIIKFNGNDISLIK
jgi:hypothetical protein